MAHRRSVRRQFYQRRSQTTGILAPGVKWSATGRFSFMGPLMDEEKLAEKRARLLLTRHGVVTKRAIEIDQVGWEWRPIYTALSLMELKGKVRRGYFVNGLPGVQFADSEFVDLMRENQQRDEFALVSATDPVYVIDRRLVSMSSRADARLLDVNRVGSTQIVFLDGRPVLVAASNGARIHTGETSDDALERAMDALVQRLSRPTSDRRVVIADWNGDPVLSSDGAELLARIGFRRDYPNMVFDALSMSAARR